MRMDRASSLRVPSTTGGEGPRMPTVLTSPSGYSGYRNQLDRARRMLERIEHAASDLDWGEINDVAFQDDM
jgi:hypothetical protein